MEQTGTSPASFRPRCTDLVPPHPWILQKCPRNQPPPGGSDSGPGKGRPAVRLVPEPFVSPPCGSCRGHRKHKASSCPLFPPPPQMSLQKLQSLLARGSILFYLEFHSKFKSSGGPAPLWGLEALASLLLCPSGIKHEEIHGLRIQWWAPSWAQDARTEYLGAVAPQKWPALPTYINTYSLNLTL